MTQRASGAARTHPQVNAWFVENMLAWQAAESGAPFHVFETDFAGSRRAETLYR